MDLEALRSSPVGQLVPIRGTDGRTNRPYDYFAYLADPLPETVELSAATWTTVARAESSLARLDQAARQVPDPSPFRRPALRREAQSTSALEGTFAPFVDVLEPDAEDRALLSPEIREILNYVIAAEAAFAWVEDRPLTSGFIGNLQKVLVEGTPGEFDDAGGPRNRLVLIGPRHAPIEESRFVPAPFGDQLQAGLDHWVEWVNTSDRELPAVVQAALAHYQFETLHPFSDGNGRIGRLCIVLQLMRLGVLKHPILVVSPWFEARRTEYQDHLLRLSETGDWDEWVRFFSTGVGAAAASTHRRIDELLSWQEHALQTVRDAGVSGVAERLAGELAGSPVLRAGQVASQHGVSHQGAMNALRRLAAIGLVREGRRNGQVVFYADDVVALLER
jgi:Fic family protein